MKAVRTAVTDGHPSLRAPRHGGPAVTSHPPCSPTPRGLCVPPADPLSRHPEVRRPGRGAWTGPQVSTQGAQSPALPRGLQNLSSHLLPGTQIRQMSNTAPSGTWGDQSREGQGLHLGSPRQEGSRQSNEGHFRPPIHGGSASHSPAQPPHQTPVPSPWAPGPWWPLHPSMRPPLVHRAPGPCPARGFLFAAVGRQAEGSGSR